jgi:nucleotide-binding universal stress UspA family protein
MPSGTDRSQIAAVKREARMDVKTLMVTVDADTASDARLGLACRMARALNAALIGVAAGESIPPALADPYLGGGLSTETLETFRALVEEDLQRLEVRFKATAAAHLVEGIWRGRPGSPANVVVEEAASVDLIVTGRRSPLCDARAPDPGDLILRAGKPILVAPPAPFGEVVGGRVLVAWSRSREARLAITGALPLLRLAQEVTLVTVTSELATAGVDQALQAQVDWLRSHGVIATALSRASLQDVGDELLDLAAEMGADLLVAGGYGHSRMQEWIMGGVTRALLGHGKTCVLFAH